jgi:hypothetical protein
MVAISYRIAIVDGNADPLATVEYKDQLKNAMATMVLALMDVSSGARMLSRELNVMVNSDPVVVTNNNISEFQREVLLLTNGTVVLTLLFLIGRPQMLFDCSV